jgi:hypothetical protein
VDSLTAARGGTRHMSSVAGIPAARPYFLWLLSGFTALVLLSWPIVFSFDLWVLKDRGNLLNVDYLLEHHLRLGVDAFYSYGLLPVLLQHWVFSVFGRGYWPMLGFNCLYIALTAVFWAWFARSTPAPGRWLLVVVAFIPILLWVNPNFPYVLVQLALLFALLLVYQQRLSGALCLAIVGWFSVPSLPLIVVAAIVVLMALQWWQSERRPLGLVRLFVPGVVLFAALAVVCGGYFGWTSLAATLLPTSGAEFYRTNHFGLFNRGSGLDFLYPADVSWRYYLANRAGWWIASSVVLVTFALTALYISVRQRRVSGACAVILICAAVHLVFAFRAYGFPGQHIIYDPVLALGTLAGLAWLPLGRWRNPVLSVLVALGVLGTWGQVHETFSAWRTMRPSPATAHLYANSRWSEEWSGILSLAARHPALLLSYGTGAHHYFPAIQTADSWTLQKGQMLPADLLRLRSKIENAEVVIEDLSGPTDLLEGDPVIQRAVSSFCLATVTVNFKIYRKLADPQCQLPSERPAIELHQAPAIFLGRDLRIVDMGGALDDP